MIVLSADIWLLPLKSETCTGNGSLDFYELSGINLPQKEKKHGSPRTLLEVIKIGQFTKRRRCLRVSIEEFLGISP
jgi:hypothetical protein